MYEDDPWDALELAVQAERCSASHPYGRSVLGTRKDLRAVGRDELRAFHARWYAPANAVLVVAGDLGRGALREVERPSATSPAPGAGAGRRGPRRAAARGAPGEADREAPAGEVARLLLACRRRRPRATDHPALRLLATALGGGRTSRLHRAFVDVGQLCLRRRARSPRASRRRCLSVRASCCRASSPRRSRRCLAELPGAADETEASSSAPSRVLGADWVFSTSASTSRRSPPAARQGDLRAATGGQLAAAPAPARRGCTRSRRATSIPAAGSVLGISLPGGQAEERAGGRGECGWRRPGCRRGPSPRRARARSWSALGTWQACRLVAVRVVLPGGARRETIPGQACSPGGCSPKARAAATGAASPTTPRPGHDPRPALGGYETHGVAVDALAADWRAGSRVGRRAALRAGRFPRTACAGWRARPRPELEAQADEADVLTGRALPRAALRTAPRAGRCRATPRAWRAWRPEDCRAFHAAALAAAPSSR